MARRRPWGPLPGATPGADVGAAVVVWTAVTLRTVDWSTPRSWRLAVACAAAWASHVLLDWLGTDAMAPIGVMALWPVDSAHYLSSLHWFLPIHREFGELTTWLRDIRAVTRELLLLGPLAWAVIFLRRLGGQARRLR